MNNDETDVTWIYRTEPLSVDQWRKVIAACQSYEQRLLEGEKTSVNDFAALFPDIPAELLTPELARLHAELQDIAEPASAPQGKDVAPAARYLMLEEIRSGGMGQVFRAFDRTCGRLVALKRIRREFAEEPRMRQRFLNEVELTAELEHPGVIPVYDQSVDSDGREFYVMRLIHGAGTGTLQQAIRKFHSASPDVRTNRSQSWNSVKRSDFRRLIESVLVVADTTAYAHDRGIAHRDLKPTNILVGPHGETLIADWGLAKRINSSALTPNNDTTTQQELRETEEQESRWSSNSIGVGTPGFRAPEIQSGSAGTNLIAADIYSLGAILDCVIHGSLPRRLEAEHRWVTPRPPASLAPLTAIAGKAMSPDAANRYQNAHAMRMDLGNWLAGEPVSAYPESLAERVSKWPGRNRLMASAIAGALIIAFIAAGWFSWFQMVQKNQLGQALKTTSVLLEENQKARKSMEEAFVQRESLALHAIVEFQSLLTLNPALQSDPQFRMVREKVLLESRSFYENLARSVDQSSEIDDESRGRLTDAALALVLLENELGNFSDAIRVADSACERLRNSKRASDRLEYHLGRILTFKGNIETRNGWTEQGLADQQQAVRHLEPLLDSKELTDKDRQQAATLWSRAASPMSIGLMGKGDFQAAKELLQKILATLNARQSESFEDSLLKIQSYGNLALVQYFSKDREGTSEALEEADKATEKCESLMDGTVPFREIIEFEMMRGTLIRFKSDLMLTEGQVEPALKLQQQSLQNLTNALNKHPGNREIQSAYHSCSSRLQTVLVEQGQPIRAREVAQEWLELAKKIVERDATNLQSREFLLLANHSLGHVSETTMQTLEAERSYREALSIANNLLSTSAASESLLIQVIELNVHLIKSELTAGRMEAAQSCFDVAVENACRLKALPDLKKAVSDSLAKHMKTALRWVQQSGRQELEDNWRNKLRESDLLPPE